MNYKKFTKTTAESLIQQKKLYFCNDNFTNEFSHLGDEGLIILIEALKANENQVTNLDLSMQEIYKTETFNLLAEFLIHENCKIIKLNLTTNSNFSIEEMSAFFMSLKNPKCTLKKLNLTETSIGNQGLKLTAKVLDEIALEKIIFGFDNNMYCYNEEDKVTAHGIYEFLLSFKKSNNSNLIVEFAFHTIQGPNASLYLNKSLLKDKSSEDLKYLANCIFIKSQYEDYRTPLDVEKLQLQILDYNLSFIEHFKIKLFFDQAIQLPRLCEISEDKLDLTKYERLNSFKKTEMDDLYYLFSLEEGKKIKTLSLARHKLSFKSKEIIAKILKNNKSLRHLDLTETYHTDQEAQITLDAVNSSELETLSLNSNEKLTFRFIKFLSQISISPHLKKIDLGNNKFCNRSIKYFVKLAKNNPSLEIDLNGNYFTRKLAEIPLKAEKNIIYNEYEMEDSMDELERLYSEGGAFHESTIIN